MTASHSLSGVILVAFTNQVMADVYYLAFESCFPGLRVQVCGSLVECRKALGKNPDAYVVVDATLTDGSLADLFRDQAVLAKRAYVFVLGGDHSLLPKDIGPVQVKFLAGNSQMRDVVAKLEATLKLAAAMPHFCKISLKSLLVRNEKLRCDVYLKLSDDKYVKVLHADSLFDEAEYGRFQAKKVEYLFLRREDFLVLMDDLLAKVNSIAADPEKITLNVAFNVSNALFQTVHAAFETEGFTPQLQSLTVATANLAVATVKRNPQLRELLKKLDAERDSYLSWHSTALSFMSCKLATLLEWQSEPTFYKLALASLLHDITLPRDDLAKLLEKEEIAAAKLSEADEALVLRHPLTSAQLLQGFDEIPGEVGFIVEQHHERPTSLGFPFGIGYKEISPVTALFIIAHDIVNAMYSVPPGSFEISAYLAKRKQEKAYSKGAFGQVFRVLQDKAEDEEL